MAKRLNALALNLEEMVPIKKKRADAGKAKTLFEETDGQKTKS
jgi:hypothetical protein